MAHYSESEIESFSLRVEPYSRNTGLVSGIILPESIYNDMLHEIEDLEESLSAREAEVEKLKMDIENLEDSLQDALDENLRLATNGSSV